MKSTINKTLKINQKTRISEVLAGTKLNLRGLTNLERTWLRIIRCNECETWKILFELGVFEVPHMLTTVR